jgi:hypothetical protein
VRADVPAIPCAWRRCAPNACARAKLRPHSGHVLRVFEPAGLELLRRRALGLIRVSFPKELLIRTFPNHMLNFADTAADTPAESRSARTGAPRASVQGPRRLVSLPLMA